MSILDTGRGFKSNPYKIYTENDLFELSSYSGIGTENVHYQLQNDITLTRDWNPLGTTTTPFKGVFDGNGFTISNVNVKGSVSRLGFFGMIESATVKSLNVDGITITATAGLQHGGLVGFANKSTINDVSVKNVNITLPASASYVGGLIGKAGSGSVYTDTVFINNVSVENVTIRNGQDYLAGFIGDISSANISNSISLGDIYLYPSRTFTPSRNFSFGWVRNSSYLVLNGVIMSTEGASVGGNGGMTNISSVNAYIKRISNPRVLANYSGIWEFGGENPWDMVDGELPKQTYFGTEINPIPIYSFADITDKMMNPDYKFGLTGAYKFMNDIVFPYNINAPSSTNTRIYSVMSRNPNTEGLGGVFSGILDGDGYSLTGINHIDNQYSTGSFSIRLFEEIRNATIKNITISFDEPRGGSRGISIQFTASNIINSSLNNIRLIYNHRTNVSISSLIILSSVSAEGSSFDDIYIELNNLDSNTNYSNSINIMRTNYGNQYSPSSGNNIILNVTKGTSRALSQLFYYGGYSATPIINRFTNIISSSFPAQTTSSLISHVSASELKSGNSPVFDSFKDNWIFDGVDFPKQKVFVKMIERIEERIIQSYSKISSILLDKFKGRTLISELFTQPVMSKVKRFKGFIQTLTSYSGKSTLETIREKKNLKVNINFSETMTFDLSRFKSRLSELKNYSTKLMSNVTNIKKGEKSSNGYTKPLVSSSNTIKRFIKSMKSFIKKIGSESSSSVIRKYLIKINSFGKKVISSAHPSFLTRAYRTIASYSGNMRSIIRKYSNIYKFGKAVVSNSVGKISNQTERFTRIKKMAKSYSKRIFNESNLFYRVASPVEVYAYLTAKFNKITLFKRKNKTSMNIKESKTIIKQKNNGGGD